MRDVGAEALAVPPARLAGAGRARLTGRLAIAALLVLQVSLAAWFVTDRSPGTDAAWTGLPLDDAWIHLVYARSIAHHGLPYYNEGELEAGFTSPLWAVACAGAVLVSDLSGLPVALATKGLGVTCGIGLTLGVYALTRTLAGGVLGALFAAALTALTPGLAFAQLSGMEVSLAAALAVWALWAMQRKHDWLTGLLLGLAVITRPELVLLVACAAIVTLSFSSVEGAARRFRQLGLRVGPTVLLVGLWAAYCLAVTGSPLPNTFHAKFSPMQRDHGTLERIIEMLKWMPAGAAGMGIGAWIVAVVWANRWRAPASVVVMAAPWVLVAGLALTRDFPDGSVDFFYWQRYVMPVMPLFYIPVGVCYELTRRYHLESAGRRPAQRWLAVAALVVLPLPLLLLVPGLAQARHAYGWNCQNIEEIQVAVGRWIAANTPGDAAVVVNDAGAIRYFGRRRTIDLLGLNYYPIAHDRARLISIISSPAALRTFMQEQKADYLAVFAEVPEFQRAADSPEARPFFMRRYDARSEHYTLAPTDVQDVKTVFQRIR